MQHSSPDMVKQSLLSVIDSLSDYRNDFLVNPASDFTRVRKISFQQTLIFPMVASSDNVTTELLDFFDENILPSPSAMIQRRNQIKPSAFMELFYRFTSRIPVLKTFHGYQLLACDGSRLNLPYNPGDPETFLQCIQGRKGINQIHLNSLYDLLNDSFVDAELQSIHQMNEKAAFCQLLGRHKGSKTIYIADRGYASFNNFAYCIHHAKLFLIRLPETFAKSLCTTDDEWLVNDYEDVLFTLHIGRKRKKEFLQLDNYHCIPKKGHYDYIQAGSDGIDRLELRIIKFPLPGGTFEYLITNLPRYGFSSQIIRELYRLRWQVETAFRHLKYAGNMIHIHSLKKDFLLQEIYAKLTMYNFSSFIATCVSRKVPAACKYEYVVNHSQLQKICLRYLRGKVQNVLDLISRMMIPVRPGRRFERNLRRQSADTLNYR